MACVILATVQIKAGTQLEACRGKHDFPSGVMSSGLLRFGLGSKTHDVDLLSVEYCLPPTLGFMRLGKGFMVSVESTSQVM